MVIPIMHYCKKINDTKLLQTMQKRGNLQNNLELAIRLILAHALQLRTSFPKILQVVVYDFSVASHINVNPDLVQQYHQTLKWS